MATAGAIALFASSSLSSSSSGAWAFVRPATSNSIMRPYSGPNDPSRSPPRARDSRKYPRHLLPTSPRAPAQSTRVNGGFSNVGDDEGDNYGDGDANPRYPVEPKVYPQRWTQLAYLSLLALLSDWICFSIAASPDGFEAAYPGASAANLIDIFLFTNVASCFLVTDVVARFGMEASIKGAAAIMTLGCLLRGGVPDLVSPAWLRGIDGLGWVANAADVAGSMARGAVDALPDYASDLVGPSALTDASRAAGLEPYALIVLGTVLVGFAQPYFQCTPPTLSATWFASDERASATATALNFNQIGIAVAFLVGGHMARSESGIHDYFGLITLLCGAVTLGTMLQFEDRPPSPPSYSEIEKMMRGEREPPFLESVKKLFDTRGFRVPLAAFVCSISITNIVGTFIDEVMERGGITDQLGVDLAGAGFELAILLGGIFIGGYVDETKRYKPVTMACLLATMFCVVPLGLTDHMLGNEPVLLVAALLGLGLACGPIQPINAELAVDVAYPCDETAVESVQQVGGNLVSALMVPVAEWALHQDYEFFGKIRTLDMDIRGDALLMFALAAATIVYFNTFDAPLRRTMADGEEEEESGIKSLASSTKMITATVMVIDVAGNAIAEGGREGSTANGGRTV
jgi:predicted MFS family arabinose efflux permease